MASKKNKKDKNKKGAPEKKKGRRAMKEVVAVSMGYYGNQRRHPGSSFFIPEGEELGSWMVLKSEYDGEEAPEAEVDETEGESTGDEDKI